MKVICISCGYRSPISEGVKDNIKEGNIYTVRCEETGFSTYAERTVTAYGFEEIDGLWERELFIPLSDFDEKLLKLLRTKPLRQKNFKTRTPVKQKYPNAKNMYREDAGHTIMYWG